LSSARISPIQRIVHASNSARRQLGTIMLEEGFLTVAQLDWAMGEQNRTGLPLGQILVELDMVSAGAVANALAEQHGGLLKTEYGVSAGFQPKASEPTPALQPVELRVVADTVADPVGETTPDRARIVGELDALREQCEQLRRGVALLATELERVRDSI
jgi:hypothetical protein